jgi:hypothetical protein
MPSIDCEATSPQSLFELHPEALQWICETPHLINDTVNAVTAVDGVVFDFISLAACPIHEIAIERIRIAHKILLGLHVAPEPIIAIISDNPAFWRRLIVACTIPRLATALWPQSPSKPYRVGDVWFVPEPHDHRKSCRIMFIHRLEQPVPFIEARVVFLIKDAPGVLELNIW